MKREEHIHVLVNVYMRKEILCEAHLTESLSQTQTEKNAIQVEITLQWQQKKKEEEICVWTIPQPWLQQNCATDKSMSIQWKKFPS